MAVLTVGRVGLDPVSVDDPDRMVVRVRAGRGRELQLRGDLVAASLADTLALRDELAATVEHGRFVPVTWTGDSRIDGYYRLLAADVDVQSLNDRGFAPYSIRLQRVGSEADVEMQSVITGAVRSNVQGIDLAEAQPWHAVPLGFYAYDVPGAPSYVWRDTADGAQVKSWLDIDTTVDPKWGISPAAYYRAAATIKVGGYVRAGLACPNSPTDWELSNGLLRVTPNPTNPGRLDIETWTGSSWSSAKTWVLEWSGTAVGTWSAIDILRNDAEACAIRLTYTRSPNAGRMTVDLSLRRGSRYVEVVMAFHVATTLEIRRQSAEAGTTVTPSGATSAVAVQASADDADGQRYIAGSGESVTFDTTQGGLSVSSARKTLSAFIGTVRDAATFGNSADDLCLQYLGYVSERVVPVRR